MTATATAAQVDYLMTLAARAAEPFDYDNRIFRSAFRTAAEREAKMQAKTETGSDDPKVWRRRMMELAPLLAEQRLAEYRAGREAAASLTREQAQAMDKTAASAMIDTLKGML